jgi:hypothetical protein
MSLRAVVLVAMSACGSSPALPDAAPVASVALRGTGVP